MLLIIFTTIGLVFQDSNVGLFSMQKAVSFCTVFRLATLQKVNAGGADFALSGVSLFTSRLSFLSSRRVLVVKSVRSTKTFRVACG